MKAAELFEPENLTALAAGDENLLAEYDRHGLLLAPGETAEEFAMRLSKLSAALKDLASELKNGTPFEVAPGIKIANSMRITPEITQEAMSVTEALYDVRTDWVPGFFANESFGLLWGGCSLSDPESNLALFIIRKSFKQRRKWLFYNRRELLAHEMTHAAHQVFDQWLFEEYFAYRTAESPLRKFFGGCFIHKFDALGFLLPILLVPVAQFLDILQILPVKMWFFWILASLYPLFLCGRTLWINRLAARARNTLAGCGIKNPDAVLFRMSSGEIKLLAAKTMPQGSDLRWKLLSKRMKMEK
jgi:hypothetical protein